MKGAFFFCSLVSLALTVSCSRPEEQLIKVLKNDYANLYINNEPNKRAVIERLALFLKDHPLNDKNISTVHNLIHQLNDGHVVIYDNRAPDLLYTSGVNFVTGSNFIKSCQDCTPLLKSDKYQIVAVNNIPYAEWLKKERFSVAASTEWGRRYRITRTLEMATENKAITLSLVNTKGEMIQTTLHFKEKEPKLGAECVDGERIAPHQFRVMVKSLWCDGVNGTRSHHQADREIIFKNFKDQWDLVSSKIHPDDKIVVDLRENGGGGDREVEYFLNSFFDQSVFLYRYKYLSVTHPGKLKWLERLAPFKINLWAKIEEDYSTTSPHTQNVFFKNQIATLVSPGCFSSCEGIASALKSEKRGVMLGSTTHGGAGDPVIFPIKGTPYSINTPTCIVWQKDGKAYEGVGVSPDIAIADDPKLTDDTVLSEAVKKLY